MKNIENLYINLNTALSVKNLTADQKIRLGRVLSYIEKANFLTFEEASKMVWAVIK